MTFSCHHIGLSTSHPRRLIEFYTNKLGFKAGEKKTVSKKLMQRVFGISSSGILTKLTLGDVLVEIISPECFGIEKRPDIVSGYNHWCLSVQNKTLFLKKLEKKGVEVLQIGKNDRFIYFVKDPEGNLIEIKGEKSDR